MNELVIKNFDILELNEFELIEGVSITSTLVDRISVYKEAKNDKCI